jgi:hypothetical protein
MKVQNKKHQATEIVVIFSGAVNAAEAKDLAIYRLTPPGKNGSKKSRNSKAIKLRSAGFSAATDAVTLIPGKPFALTKPVQLVVVGAAPSGLEDSRGRLIDGGKNVVVEIGRGGVKINEARPARTDARRPVRRSLEPAAVDALLEREDFRRGGRRDRWEMMEIRNPRGDQGPLGSFDRRRIAPVR